MAKRRWNRKCKLCGSDDLFYTYGRFEGIRLWVGWLLCPKHRMEIEENPDKFIEEHRDALVS